MKTRRRMLSALLAVGMLLSAITPAFAQRPPLSAQGIPAAADAGAHLEAVPQRTLNRISPADRSTVTALPGMQLRDRSAPLPSADGKVVGSAFAVGGDQLVNSVIYLDLPSPSSLRRSGVDAATLDRTRNEIAAAQSRVEGAVAAAGGRTVFRFTTLSSGIAVQIPARAASELAALPGVVRISQVRDYEMDLSETVPFIGAEFLQTLGVTGAGVKVAVIDSGVDHSHLAFGGPGTTDGFDEAYFGSDVACDANELHDPDCAYAKPADPALFGPAAPKVKGGYDWLGEAWPITNDILPDPNPIDWEGHGTHVADIIAGFAYTAGTNADGPYLAKGAGVAPDADIYAYKACASFSTSCNGLALLKSVDSAVEAGVDIINMSLGSPYGQPEDDLTYFSNQAVAAGVIVVASAGNSANKPFIVGSPSMGDGVISVAQTAVPSARRYPLSYSSTAVSGTINSAVFQNWSTSPSGVPISGTLVYGDSDEATPNLDGCAAYDDDMTGKVVLADRGGCNFTLKAKNASAAGAVISIIGLIAPGDPFEGGDGGDRPIDIPSFMISQATSNLLKAQIANDVIVEIDPTNAIDLSYTMVGSSSRGPRNNDGMIKPDIGAPGASVSAVAGFGAETGPFGGTSGAAPMVSGALALLKEAFGDTLTPAQYKALIMNTGELDIFEGDPGSKLAGITRIGGGQVEATRAYSSTLIAWDSTDADPLKWTGSLSFGYLPATDDTSVTRILTIQNLASVAQTVELTNTFRYTDDENAGVVVTPLESVVNIDANASVTVAVRLDVYPAGNNDNDPLHNWVINKGSLGANGDSLTFQEYDGALQLTPSEGDPVHVVWQVLPKAAADTSVTGVDVVASQVTPAYLFASSAVLSNTSPGVDGVTDVFDLVEVSPNIYDYSVGDCVGFGEEPGCNISPIDIKEVGVRAYTFEGEDYLEFAVTIHDQPYRASQYPPEFDIYIDYNADGVDDYVIFNGDLTLNASDGRNVVFVVNLSNNALTPAFFIDSTFNTQNFILPIDMASVGVTMGEPFVFKVFAFDAYFNGDLWDCAPFANCESPSKNVGYRYTPGKQRFVVAEADQILDVPAAGSTTLNWTEPATGFSDSPSQTGLLFLHRNAPIGRESDYLHMVAPPLSLPLLFDSTITE